MEENKKKNLKWTPEQIEILKQCYPFDSWEDIFKKLNCNNKTRIIDKASDLKISREVYNQCHKTDDEVQYILNNYTQKSLSEIGRDLSRDVSFVSRIVREYNLDISLAPGHLHKDDEELFIKLYPYYTNNYLSQVYFTYLTPHQLRTQAKRLKLVKAEEKSVKWYDKEDLLDRLEHVIRTLGRVPMLQELQDNGLPSDKTFTRYFGGLTKACELLGVERPNYQHIIVSKEGVYYDDLKNPCLSKTEQIISNFLISHNIVFQKEVLYKTVIPVNECGEKRFDWKIGDKYIEYFGLSGYHDYDIKTENKLNLIKKYNINCLSLYPSDMQKAEKWQNKILNFLQL